MRRRQAPPLVAFLVAAPLLWSPARAAPPVLAGVFIGGGARVALLKPAEGGTVEAREGETVSGFTVQRILTEQVMGENEGQTLVLSLGPPAPAGPVPDTGGATFGLVVNAPAPAPD